VGREGKASRRESEKKPLPPKKQNDKKKDVLLDLAQTSLREDPLREKQKTERDDRQRRRQARAE
jgi:hypothetical protein